MNTKHYICFYFDDTEKLCFLNFVMFLKYDIFMDKKDGITFIVPLTSIVQDWIHPILFVSDPYKGGKIEVQDFKNAAEEGEYISLYFCVLIVILFWCFSLQNSKCRAAVHVPWLVFHLDPFGGWFRAPIGNNDQCMLFINIKTN